MSFPPYDGMIAHGLLSPMVLRLAGEPQPGVEHTVHKPSIMLSS